MTDDQNMHMTVADMFNLMTRHATYLRDSTSDIPAAMQQLNSTYLNDIYPYSPDLLMARLMNIAIDRAEKKEQLEELLHSSENALIVLRDIIGYHMTKTTPEIHAWGKAFEKHIVTYPLGEEALYKEEGFTIVADIAVPAQYLHLINPNLRDLQRATNLNDPRHMKPDEWIWLGGRRLNNALRAYLAFVDEDVAKFDSYLAKQSKHISWQVRLTRHIKQLLKSSLRRQSSG